MAATLPDRPATGCLICGSTDNPTVEHIVPQALWRRFELDPNDERLARYRTILCRIHNCATSRLHQRAEVLDLIEKGESATRKSLGLLADWATWVTLLLGLATGEGVLPQEEARRLLTERFDGNNGGLPKGLRVYIARVDEYVSGTAFVSHMVCVEQDGRIVLDHAGVPSGFRVRTGPVTTTEAIGLGKVAILVLARTYPSGPDHDARLDLAASTVGLDRIHPPQADAPELASGKVDITAVSQVFMPVMHGTDTSLLPPAVRTTVEMLLPQGH